MIIRYCSKECNWIFKYKICR